MVRFKLDAKDLTIVEYQFLKMNMPMIAETVKSIKDDFLLSEYVDREWKRDENNGELLFMNKAKIEAQSGIINYVLKKMGSNLLNGKPVT